VTEDQLRDPLKEHMQAEFNKLKNFPVNNDAEAQPLVK